MKTIVSDVLFVIFTGLVLFFVLNEKLLHAFLIVALQIVIVLNQIHDTLKAKWKGEAP